MLGAFTGQTGFAQGNCGLLDCRDLVVAVCRNERDVIVAGDHLFEMGGNRADRQNHPLVQCALRKQQQSAKQQRQDHQHGQ